MVCKGCTGWEAGGEGSYDDHPYHPSHHFTSNFSFVPQSFHLDNNTWFALPLSIVELFSKVQISCPHWLNLDHCQPILFYAVLFFTRRPFGECRPPPSSSSEQLRPENPGPAVVILGREPLLFQRINSGTRMGLVLMLKHQSGFLSLH